MKADPWGNRLPGRHKAGAGGKRNLTRMLARGLIAIESKRPHLTRTVTLHAVSCQDRLHIEVISGGATRKAFPEEEQ